MILEYHIQYHRYWNRLYMVPLYWELGIFPVLNQYNIRDAFFREVGKNTPNKAIERERERERERWHAHSPAKD